MGIKNIQISQVGLVGVVPQWLYLETDNTLAEVTTAGYLNTVVEVGGYSLAENMLAVVSTIEVAGGAVSVGTYNVTFSAGNWSLQASTVPDGSITTAKIADLAVTTAKIAAGAVTLAKLATGVAPAGVIKYMGQLTTVGGAAAEAFTVTGAVASTDRAFVQVVDNGTSNVTVLQAVVTNNTLTVTFSANPGNDTIINYQIIRAAS